MSFSDGRSRAVQTSRRTSVILATAAALVALLATACSTSSSGGKSGGTPIKGGTVTVGLSQDGGPNYIFPMVSPQYCTSENAGYFSYLMYRPVYWFGVGSGTAVNYKLSVGQAPKFTNNNQTVTITLNNYKWSDGQPVTTRDISFWENLVTANKTSYCAYSPGTYPDNVKTFKVIDDKTFQLTFDKPYSQHWLLYNEISQIIPMPQHLWDRESASGAVGNYDTTAKGAQAVYKFLDSRSKKVSSYDSDPLWKVVDGPWKLKSIDSNGNTAMVPNPAYTGPVKPQIAEFDQKPFTDSAAEFNSLLSGSGPQIGYISPVDLKSQGTLNRLGYVQSKNYSFATTYAFLNFTNPKTGPLFKQLYIRQAIQLLYNQAGYIKNYESGAGYTNCGPIPTQPANAFADNYEKSCPFAYNPQKAAQLLSSHGWKVVPHGVTTCQSPGTGANQCGAGIAAGTKLEFTVLWPTGGIAFPKIMAQSKADAAVDGLVLNLKGETYNTLGAIIAPCKAGSKCGWDISQTGGWIYVPDYYPTGEELFTTGAGYNLGGYSDKHADALIAASTKPGNDQQTLNAYEDYMAQQIPVLWTDNTYTLQEVKSNLHGVTPWNVYGSVTPESWYFTK
jgi:peptide/nickel transport system substrate-binding protein